MNFVYSNGCVSRLTNTNVISDGQSPISERKVIDNEVKTTTITSAKKIRNSKNTNNTACILT